jgi:hypothetical protein
MGGLMRGEVCHKIGTDLQALEHDLVLITRNLNDVLDLPVAVANPWDPQAGEWVGR